MTGKKALRCFQRDGPMSVSHPLSGKKNSSSWGFAPLLRDVVHHEKPLQSSVQCLHLSRRNPLRLANRIFAVVSVVRPAGSPFLPSTMSRITMILGVLVFVLLGAGQARESGPQGIFELRLKEFRNFYASDIDGNCCQPQDRFGSSCVGRCDTKFRICLKHYQKEVALGQGCTFGEEITPVLGSNNLTIHRPPIKFDINFKWPVGFTN